MATITVSSSVSSGLRFSAVFSDHAVLQRATAANPKTRAAVYGASNGDRPITARLLASSGDSGTVALHEQVVAPSPTDGTWKAFLPPHGAGGDFTVEASDGGGIVELKREGRE